MTLLEETGQERWRIELWTAQFARAGWLGEWDDLAGVVRAVGPGTATWTVPSDAQYAGVLLTPGTRATLSYRPEPGPSDVVGDPDHPPWLQIASGRVKAKTSGPASSARIECSLVDHWSALNVLTWPRPASAISAQTVENYTASGPAEDVITDLVAANGTRLALPLDVPTSAHRGTTVPVSTRMARLGDVVIALAKQGGLTARVVQVADGLQLVLGGGRDRTHLVLSERGANIDEWTWQITPPTVTRVVVGGRGEGAARDFLTRANTTTEDLWGLVAEDFVDARDLDSAAGTYTAQMQARGDAAIAAGSASVDGLKVVLAESDGLRYGVDLSEGDRIRVELAPEFPVEARIEEVAFSAKTGTGGTTFSPVVGDPTVGVPERVQAQIIAGLNRGMATLRAR